MIVAMAINNGGAPQAPAASPSARALRAVREGDYGLAESILSELIADVFSLRVESVKISRDRYSLNSVNGFVRVHDVRDYFFKFHHEEGEEVTLEEFYRGELLKEAGYPVDVPVYVSRTVGSQVLMYDRRTSQRLADLCERLDFAPLAEARSVLDAQSHLDALTSDIYARTLHPAPASRVEREPINQLFHHRLITPGHPDEPGGRAKRFFWDRTFDLAGMPVSAEDLRSATWVVNGISYQDSIDVLLARSRALLEPARLAEFGAVTAHGDAHNANVWWDADSPGGARLVFFDPAFAGNDVSALIAEAKSTFHNIFAHPLWLYHANRATELYSVASRRRGNVIEIVTDWGLSPLRENFLASKATRLWKPLLERMNERRLLSADWRATLRCALFCCPTLVMDLCAGGTGGHTPVSSCIGLATAVMVGSEPGGGQHDIVTRFLDSIDPNRS
jgi:hypothetical protein